MKKIVVLVLALAMTVGLGAYVFAEEVETDYICQLTDEQQAYMLEVKEAFLTEIVADGEITQAEADEILAELKENTRTRSMRGLGFGIWLRDSEYADDFYDMMPRNNSFGGMRGRGRGSRGCNY